jgi:hypothetical protein
MIASSLRLSRRTGTGAIESLLLTMPMECGHRFVGAGKLPGTENIFTECYPESGDCDEQEQHGT